MEMLRLDKVALGVGDFSLHNIDFAVDEGEYFILLGPSGAGKSLILELIAGFYTPQLGKVFLSQKEITNLPIQKREVGLLFRTLPYFPT
jgi:ABC-type Fe3+/spermidine/putrescine transport system ATPase subunit